LAKDQRPRRYFYLLSPVAFAVWALGTSAIMRDLIGIGAKTSEFVLAFTVFLIPLVDWGLGKAIDWVLPRLRRVPATAS
jgi:hypothetical protein